MPRGVCAQGIEKALYAQAMEGLPRIMRCKRLIRRSRARAWACTDSACWESAGEHFLGRL